MWIVLIGWNVQKSRLRNTVMNFIIYFSTKCYFFKICKRKSFNELRIFGDNPKFMVMLYKPCFDQSWVEKLGECASLVVFVAHRRQTDRTAYEYCSTSMASYRRSTHRSYATAKTLWKVNCRTYYCTNERAIFLSSLCGIGQSVTSDTCHLWIYSLQFERFVALANKADRSVSDHQQTFPLIY